jgi:hypothetical protein
MATGPDKDKIIKLFGPEFWDYKGSKIKYESNIKAVKTHYIKGRLFCDFDYNYNTDGSYDCYDSSHNYDDYLGNDSADGENVCVLGSACALKDATDEKLQGRLEWWSPYIWSGLRWEAWPHAAPWLKNPHDSRSHIIQEKISVIVHRLGFSDEDYPKDVLFLMRLLMDCPPNCEMDELKASNAKDFLDAAIEKIDHNPYRALVSAFYAGQCDTLKFQKESIREQQIKTMPLAKQNFGRNKGSKKKLEQWQKDLVLFWGKHKGKKPDEILALVYDRNLVTKGEGPKNGGKYQLGGVGNYIEAYSVKRNVERWEEKLNSV